VRVGGVTASVSGLAGGKIQFLSASGTLTDTPPSTPGQYVQALGFALDSSSLAVAPSTALNIR